MRHPWTSQNLPLHLPITLPTGQHAQSSAATRFLHTQDANTLYGEFKIPPSIIVEGRDISHSGRWAE